MMASEARNDVLLECADLHAAYDDGREVLHGISFEVSPGEVTLLIGPNGAGKSTVLRTVSGLTSLLRGSVRLRHREIGGASPEDVTRAGVAHVLQGRTAIPFLTVEENLRLGGYGMRRDRVDENIARVLRWIPPLNDFAGRLAGTLSGGQQQLVELGRALVRGPTLMMVDEPSLGLSPKAASDILLMIRRIADEGVAVVMVEQKVRQAFGLADTVVILRQGAVVMGPLPRASLTLEEIRSVYMGNALA
jgi:branched-chain amino acid transport system ATP-binding protein